MNPPASARVDRLPWFGIGLGAIFLLSLVLRFWDLGRIGSLVFDEVHFAKFANSYLHRLPFLEIHPPLGKYFIAAGIWLGQLFGWNSAPTVTIDGHALAPFSFRWMNALVGAFIPLAIAGLAYELARRRSFALIAGAFAACDGLLLVESRYALLNIYLVLFGVLGQWLLLRALTRPRRARQTHLILAGIAFGAAASVKWNGLGFLLGAYLSWTAAKVIDWLRQRPATAGWSLPRPAVTRPEPLPLQRLYELSATRIGVTLGLIPVLVYVLLWIPHLQLNSQIQGFWEWQRYSLASHRGTGSGPEVHPYCSAWTSWPLMLRPVAYYYQMSDRSSTAPRPEASAGSPNVVFDVHGMGNPPLWWAGTGAMLLLAGWLLQRGSLLSSRWVLRRGKQRILDDPDFWVALTLTLNYLANWLPWAGVGRCVFLYHYMEANVFALLAIAWLTARGLEGPAPWRRWASVAIIALVCTGFSYWLPLFLGLPLAPDAFHARMWLRSWY